MELKETYYEQFVKGKIDFKLRLAILLNLIFIAACLFLTFVNREKILFLFLAALGIIIYKATGKYRNQMYEYAMYDSELNIAILYNRKKREEVVSFDVKDAELVAYRGSDRILQHRIEVVKDYTSGKKGRQVYGIVVELEKRLNCIYIEPNEDILKNIIKYSEHKFIG